jgi:transposase
VRGHLAEFGLVAARGPWNVPLLLASMEQDQRVPEPARQVVQLFAAQLEDVGKRIAEVEARIAAWHKANPVSRRLTTIPGIGPLIATAIVATVPDPEVFRSGREFAAWLGLVPRQKSTGGKPRLGRISRLGDKYIRQLLIIGAQTVLLRSKVARSNRWIQSLLARRPRLVVAVALANKTARIVWAVMANGQSYRQAAPA